MIPCRSSLPQNLDQTFIDVITHLEGVGDTPLFLNLLEQFLSSTDSCHAESVILRIAKLLKGLPAALYKLNRLFKPHARLEFNVKRNPVTCCVLKTQDTSRIVLLDSSSDHVPLLHDLSATSLRDILLYRRPGDCVYDTLCGVEDPALLDCLAQLAQDILDTLITKPCRKAVFNFLRTCGGVPPSLHLHELEQLEIFQMTYLSDLYHGDLNGTKVVVKAPRPQMLKQGFSERDVLREVMLCRQFRHPNILPFLGVSCDEGRWLYSLVTPFMKYGNVNDFLRSYPGVNRLTPILQIMKGLEFLHNFDTPVAHRDVKGANVLVNDALVCCLCDFGLSSVPELSQRSQEHAMGTAPWMAPEILAPPEYGRLDLFKIDIFALGVTIIEIYLGKPPLHDHRFPAIYKARVLRKETPLLSTQSSSETLPPFLRELIAMMLDHDPLKRPGIRMICQGVEDELSPPPRIPIDAVVHSPVACGTGEMSNGSVRLLAAELVTHYKMAGLSSSAADPVVPLSIKSSALSLPRTTAKGRQADRGVLPPQVRNVKVFGGLTTPVTEGPSPLITTTMLPRQVDNIARASVGQDILPSSPTISSNLPHIALIQHPRPLRPTIQLGSARKLPPRFTPYRSGGSPTPLSPPTLKRTLLSSFVDDGRDEQENMQPLPVQYDGQKISSPPRTRRRHDSSLSPSPTATSSRIGELGPSAH